MPSPAEAAIRRVFIDCTATWERDTNTGIQRVVRNIVNTAAKVGPELGLCCQGVVFDLRSGFVPIERLPSPVAQGRAARPSLGERFRTKAKEWLVATHTLDVARALKHQVQRARYQLYFPSRRKSTAAVHCGPGDVLLLIDSSWEPTYPWDDVCEAQARGALVGLVVYDLIPVQFPEVVGQRTHDLYSRWWDKARTRADFVVGISRSVLDDIDAVDRARRPAGAPKATLQSGFFKLGAELDGSVYGGPVSPELAVPFGQPGARKAYLMVGMISPRKNHALVLDAFDRLWAGGADMELVIAGKYGWDCGSLMDRIRRHPQFGRKLFWFENVQDHELDYCYRHAAGLITGSYAEGFNLPIVEALSKGCPVLASDLAVHREVGGEYAAYFPLGDAPALAGLVARHQRHGVLPGTNSAASFHWPDWTESCRDLLARVVELGARAAASPRPERGAQGRPADLRPAA